MTIWGLIFAICAAPFECAFPVWTDTVIHIETYLTIGDNRAIHCTYVVHENRIVKNTKHTRGQCLPL